MTLLDRPLFQTDEVAGAAGIPVESLKNWLKRGLLALNQADDEFNPGTGRARRFTLRRALQIALTAELSRRGFQVEDASKTAVKFTDLGETVGFWVGEPVPQGRLPGELFKDGPTILAVFFDPAGETESRVLKLPELAKKYAQHSNTSTSAILINVNEIVERVLKHLGLWHSGVPTKDELPDA